MFLHGIFFFSTVSLNSLKWPCTVKKLKAFAHFRSSPLPQLILSSGICRFMKLRIHVFEGCFMSTLCPFASRMAWISGWMVCLFNGCPVSAMLRLWMFGPNFTSFLQYFTLPHVVRVDSEDCPSCPRTVRRQSEDSLNSPSRVRVVRRQSEDSPSSPTTTEFSNILGLCSDFGQTLLGLC